MARFSTSIATHGLVYSSIHRFLSNNALFSINRFYCREQSERSYFPLMPSAIGTRVRLVRIFPEPTLVRPRASSSRYRSAASDSISASSSIHVSSRFTYGSPKVHLKRSVLEPALPGFVDAKVAEHPVPGYLWFWSQVGLEWTREAASGKVRVPLAVSEGRISIDSDRGRNLRPAALRFWVGSVPEPGPSHSDCLQISCCTDTPLEIDGSDQAGLAQFFDGLGVIVA